ncbi:MAG: retropepsin-like aspartic protease [Planctomycetota bacterium]
MSTNPLSSLWNFFQDRNLILGSARGQIVILMLLPLFCAEASSVEDGNMPTAQEAPPPSTPGLQDDGNNIEGESLETILSHIRTAIGYENVAEKTAPVKLQSLIRDAAGKETQVETIFSSNGCFFQRFTGALNRLAGFDGTTPWSVEKGCGMELTLAGRETTLVGVWLRTGYWLHPAAPLQIQREPDEDEEGMKCLSLMLRGGLIKWRMQVDEDAWLPATIQFSMIGRETMIGFHDYHDHSGWKVPDRVTNFSYGRMTTESFTKSFTDAVDFDRSLFVPQLGLPEDTRFDASLPAKLEAKVLRGHGAMMIHPLINGKDVGWFLFDTGAAGWTLSLKAAEAAGLEELRDSPTTSVAGRLIESSLCLAREVRIGPAVFENQIMRAAASAGIGDECIGLIGYGLLARCVVEYDDLASTISIYDPRKYSNEGLPWQDMVPGQIVPTIEASFEEHTELFRIDTGASSELVLNTPCVERLGLLQDRETFSIEASGMDGLFTMQRGTIDWIEFGGKRFRSVTTDFSKRTAGVLADPYTAGIIGHGLLKSFKLVIDYPNSRIAFVPSS